MRVLVFVAHGTRYSVPLAAWVRTVRTYNLTNTYVGMLASFSAFDLLACFSIACFAQALG